MLSEDKAKELMNEAQSDRYQGRYKEALEKFNALIRELGYPYPIRKEWARLKVGEVMHQIGVTYQNMEDFKMALYHLRRAAIFRRVIKDEIGLANSQFQVAMCRQASGEDIKNVMFDFLEASEAIHRAIYVLREENDYKTAANMYHRLAYICQIEGDFKEALNIYQIALLLREKDTDQRAKGLTYARQAECNLALDNILLAKTNAEEALKIFKAMYDIKEIAQIEKTLKEIKQKEEKK